MRDFWRLPGAARWLGAIASDRAAGRSGVVVCPSEYSPPDLVDALRGLSQPGEPEIFVIESRHGAYCGSSSPDQNAIRLVRIAAERLYLGPVADLSSLATDPALSRVSVIVDARTEDLGVQAAWGAFAARFAESCRTLAYRTRPTVWVLMAPVDGAEPPLPRTDVTFRHRWWWGVLGPVDSAATAESLGFDPDVAACALDVARWDLPLLEELRSWDGTVGGLVTWLPVWASPGLDELPDSQQLEAAGGVLEPWRGTDIAGMEIGPLAACLLAHRVEHRLAVPTERVDLLCDLRNARNALAHRRPVDPATVTSLRRRACVDRRR